MSCLESRNPNPETRKVSEEAITDKMEIQNFVNPRNACQIDEIRDQKSIPIATYIWGLPLKNLFISHAQSKRRK
jgi:hypothetical protein